MHVALNPKPAVSLSAEPLCYQLLEQIIVHEPRENILILVDPLDKKDFE